MLSRLLAFVQCLVEGHKFYNSKKRRGYMTCVHCGYRRRY